MVQMAKVHFNFVEPPESSIQTPESRQQKIAHFKATRCCPHCRCHYLLFYLGTWNNLPSSHDALAPTCPAVALIFLLFLTLDSRILTLGTVRLSPSQFEPWGIAHPTPPFNDFHHANIPFDFNLGKDKTSRNSIALLYSLRLPPFLEVIIKPKIHPLSLPPP